MNASAFIRARKRGFVERRTYMNTNNRPAAKSFGSRLTTVIIIDKERFAWGTACTNVF